MWQDYTINKTVDDGGIHKVKINQGLHPKTMADRYIILRDI